MGLSAIEEQRNETLIAKLVQLGTALARSIGHNPGMRCPKVSPAVPCTCGAGQQQAKALDDWQHAMADLKESTSVPLTRS